MVLSFAIAMKKTTVAFNLAAVANYSSLASRLMRIFHLKCSTSTYSLPQLAALHGRQCTSDSGSTNILGGASLASGVSGAGASAGSRNRNVSGPVTHPETQPTSRETNPGRRSSEDRDS